jgi:hypothetical protein
MQQNDPEIMMLEKEIATLEAQKELLAKIRDMKLKKLSASMQNIPKKFEAKHPVIGFLARQGYHTARGLGHALGQGASAYINFLRKEQEREARLKQKYPRAFKNKA